MNDIDTYVLINELSSRLDDYLHAPEPRHDAVLDDLWTESVTSEQNMKALLAKLENTSRRYKNIVEARIKEMEEFS